MPLFEICGSPCEYWWSWVIDYPPRDICILICRPRNGLYKPFFLLGLVFLALALTLRVVFEKKKKQWNKF